jgi:hypothetical protein
MHIDEASVVAATEMPGEGERWFKTSKYEVEKGYPHELFGGEMENIDKYDSGLYHP